jgi:hypothetical protein
MPTALQKPMMIFLYNGEIGVETTLIAGGNSNDNSHFKFKIQEIIYKFKSRNL